MRCSDLKRAVEDVVLRPDENRLAELQKRGTIAALDLCQVTSPSSASHNDNAGICASSACSCSSDFGVASTSSSSNTNTTTNTTITTNSPPPPLCASSSLDAIMTSSRPQQPSLFNRHSASGSRRQSRVFSNSFASKRKRSNSLTNYNKGQSLSVSLPPSARHTPHRFVIASDEETAAAAAAYRSSLASSDSHSSVAEGFVLEEEEQHQSHQQEYSHHQNPPPPPPSHHSPCSSTSSSFTTWRQPKQLIDYDDDMMDCD